MLTECTRSDICLEGRGWATGCIRKGLDSGPAEPLDIEAVKTEARKSLSKQVSGHGEQGQGACRQRTRRKRDKRRHPPPLCPRVLPAPPRTPPLMPERTEFLDGESPAPAKVEAFLAQAFAASGSDGPAKALVPWICDALLSNHSVKAYGRDLMDFLRHMQAQGVTPLEVTADHVKLYKRALLEAGLKSATVARRLSVIRGTFKELAAKGLIAWETAQDIGAVKAAAVQKNSTPSLTQRQAISLLEAIPTETLQGIRDLALMSVFFITGCRVSAIVHACVGHLESDGVEHYLHVTEKRGKKAAEDPLGRRATGLGVHRRAGIGEDKEGPLFRPIRPDGTGLERRHLDRKTPWRLVKKYCRATGIT